MFVFQNRYTLVCEVILFRIYNIHIIIPYYILINYVLNSNFELVLVGNFKVMFGNH